MDVYSVKWAWLKPTPHLTKCVSGVWVSFFDNEDGDRGEVAIFCRDIEGIGHEDETGSRFR
jgi:hypothetical protein